MREVFTGIFCWSGLVRFVLLIIRFQPSQRATTRDGVRWKRRWYHWGEGWGPISMPACVFFPFLLYTVIFVFLGLNGLDVSRFGRGRVGCRDPPCTPRIHFLRLAAPGVCVLTRYGVRAAGRLRRDDAMTRWCMASATTAANYSFHSLRGLCWS